MVIFYNLKTKEIKGIEENVMIPTLPTNSTFEDKVKHYNSENEGFVALPYELGIYVWDYELCFNSEGKFTGIQPKGVV